MASIQKKQKSRYWMARFADESGHPVTRSTKETDKTKAKAMADKWEKAARQARRGELTQAASIKILSELMENTIGDQLTVETIASFFRAWMGQRRPDTAKRYKPIIDGFLESLGEKRASASISTVTAGEIERFRDEEIASGKGATTANYAV